MRDGRPHGMAGRGNGRRAIPTAARGKQGGAPAKITTNRRRRRMSTMIAASRRNGPMPPKRDGRREGAPTGGRKQRDLLLRIRPSMRSRGRHRRRCLRGRIKPPRIRMARERRARVRISYRGEIRRNRTPHRTTCRRRAARIHWTSRNRKRKTPQDGRTPHGDGGRRGNPSRSR
jgi:hypothetical protein